MDIKKRINWRILWVCLVLISMFSAVTIRLWWVQSVQASWILDKASKQWEREQVLKQKRGPIVDRNNNLLAYDGKAFKVEAQLKPNLIPGTDKPQDDDYVKDPYMTAQVLSGILGMSQETLLNRLTLPDKKNVELGFTANKITDEQRKKILDLQYPLDASGKPSKKNMLPGIHVYETTKRVYPNNSFASNVIGYVNFNDEAVNGIEKEFDDKLKGKPGELHVMRDAAGYPMPGGEQSFTAPVDGMKAVLTIDKQIQDYVEQELDRTVAQYKPKNAMVIVTDPKTGEILAMGNRPTFNPNQYWEVGTDYQRLNNQAISSVFEPGSTFKIITLAAAIQEGKFNPNATYQSGSYRKFSKPIRDHNNGAGWGQITFLKGVQRSSNVAFVILGYEKLGKVLLDKYFKAFGVGQPTHIDLPGESAGIMRDLLSKRTPERDIAVTTFGQGVAVTAIQQMMAVGAIANGGDLLKPLIVKEFRNANTDAVVQRFDKQVVRNVVSESTAKQTRDALATVVSDKDGTGKWFKLDDYQVAGKTGTAQKYDPKNGKILDGKYIYSFIGFAPANDPRLLVYVVVDDPQTSYAYTEIGHYVVAPIFKSVMEKSLKYLEQQKGVLTPSQALEEVKEKEVTPDIAETSVPKFVGMTTSAAQAKAKQEGYQAQVVGTGTKIVEQQPDAFEKVAPGSKVILITDKLQQLTMPDFKGKTLRDVLEFASMLGMPVQVSGVGFVTDQSIAPGTGITGKERLSITLAEADQPPASTSAPAESTGNASTGETSGQNGATTDPNQPGRKKAQGDATQQSEQNGSKKTFE